MQKNMSVNAIKSCSISNHRCIVDGQEVFRTNAEQTNDEFLTALYKQTGISYPKFFKMDLLSKAGFIAAEYLFNDCDPDDLRDTCIYLSNYNSCLLTDLKHAENIQSSDAYFPSPSVFVYTLPNIVIGEISIRHKIMGEGVFFLSEKPNFEELKTYADMVLQNGLSKQVLIGRLGVEDKSISVDFILLK